MPKRNIESHDAQTYIDTKRAKRPAGIDLGRASSHGKGSANYIDDLVSSDQANLAESLRKVSCFLESIASSEDASIKSDGLHAVSDYLKLVTPGEDDPPSDVLLELSQIWSNAVQAEDENIRSLIPTIYSRMLNLMSNDIQFERVGNTLCKALLGKEQVKLTNVGLSTSASKEPSISACLTLMKELTSFGGGAHARTVYARRFHIYNRWDLYLDGRRLRNPTPHTKSESTIRSLALSCLAANLRHQDQAVKCELLCHPQMARMIFNNLLEDPPSVILELLNCFWSNIVQDRNVKRSAKRRIFSESTLITIRSLYEYSAENNQRITQDISNIAHEILIFLCTSRAGGVLVAQHGWHPSTVSETNNEAPLQTERRLTTRVHARAKYNARVPVNNTRLASFLQSLKPYANARECELAIAILKAAPELVADYFMRKKRSSFDPRLSSTWIGYNSFLFSTIQLPIPDSISTEGKFNRLSPPVAIIIESVLPQPLNKQNMAKVLCHSSKLVQLLGLKLLSASFRKLEQVLHHLKSERVGWDEAAPLLIELFGRRCPDFRYVVTIFRACWNSGSFVTELVANLLASYFKFVPQLVVDKMLDISLILIQRLQNIEKGKASEQRASNQRLELLHLLKIACCSTSMRWWYKADGMSLSPFTSILRLYSCGLEGTFEDIEELLKSIAYHHFIFQQRSVISPLATLIASVDREQTTQSSNTEIWDYLDDCILRLVRKPLKYCGLARELTGNPERNSILSRQPRLNLLTVVLAEQWSFLVRRMESDKLRNVAAWLNRYLNASLITGEAPQAVARIKAHIKSHSGNSDVSKEFENSHICPIPESLTTSRESKPSSNVSATRPDGQSTPTYNDLKPPQEASTHTGLYKWAKKDIFDAVDDGLVGELILCLCSQFEEVRMQAMGNCRILHSKLEASGYCNWRQLHLLIGELLETMERNFHSEALPSFTGVIAARGVSVLHSPLHPIYGKMNRWLHKSPSWNCMKLPAYWIDSILLQLPDTGNTHTEEAQWLFETLFEGLRTPNDLTIYVRCGVFEHLMCLVFVTTIPRELRGEIFGLLMRAMLIEGNTVLVTRCGITDWLNIISSQGEHERDIVKPLEILVQKTCRENHIPGWTDIARPSLL